jgi:predicted transposase YdaD
VLRLLALLPEEMRLQFLETVLRYIMAAAPHVTEPELRRIVVEVLAQQGEAAVGTIAETLIQQGRQEGKREGRQEGRQEGAQMALRNSILTVLRTRFELSDEQGQAVTRRLAQISDLARLEMLLAQVLNDTSLAEFEQRIR